VAKTINGTQKKQSSLPGLKRVAGNFPFVFDFKKALPFLLRAIKFS
jgi:hypothetical protein